jgi:HD superfamily phosphohydrolase
MKFVGSLRDPVYGVVPITAIEKDILKLPLMNRLKNIKQLGLAYLAFAGANHTRFEHSVGAMHVAHLMATGLELNESEIEAVRIAALLHDVGHPPFSHCIEFASRLFGITEIPDHTIVTKDKIIHDAKLHEILKLNRPLIRLEDVAELKDRMMKIKQETSKLDDHFFANRFDKPITMLNNAQLKVRQIIVNINSVLSLERELESEDLEEE